MLKELSNHIHRSIVPSIAQLCHDISMCVAFFEMVGTTKKSSWNVRFLTAHQASWSASLIFQYDNDDHHHHDHNYDYDECDDHDHDVNLWKMSYLLWPSEAVIDAHNDVLSNVWSNRALFVQLNAGLMSLSSGALMQCIIDDRHHRGFGDGLAVVRSVGHVEEVK